MATEKEEKGKIQLVTPLAIQKRWEDLQDSPKYRDQAKYKLLEDMITSMEIATFGIDHPEYASQLEDLDKFWSAIRNFLTRLISDTEKADENARKRLENTLRKLEADVAKIPQIEESRRDYFSKYFDASKRIEELSKSLEEAKKRTDEAEARCKEAEARATKLQNRLNVANETIVKQMQEFMAKYSATIEKAETVDEKVTLNTVPETADNVPTTPDAAVTEDTTSTAPLDATANNTPVSETGEVTTAEPVTSASENRRGRKKKNSDQ